METCKELKDLAKLFKDKGYTLYIVGGFVRDSLLGYTPHDIDITSSMIVEDVQNLCKENKIKHTVINKNLGTIQIKINSQEFEYTTFRKESYKVQGDHSPSEVEFVDNINLDALRRDLTINAIYYDIINEEIIDPLQGFKDISNKIIKTANYPSITLADDGLRILRIIRFASMLNFKFDKTTYKELKFNKSRLLKISKERILKELKELVIADYKHNLDNKIAIKIINKLKLLPIIFNKTLTKTKISKLNINKFYLLPKESRLIGFYILVLTSYVKNLVNDSQLSYIVNSILGNDGIKESKDNIFVTQKVFKIFQNLEYNTDTINASVNYLTLSDAERIIISTLLSKKANIELSDNISIIKARNLPLSIHDLDICAEDLIDAKIERKFISKILSSLFNQVIEMKVMNRRKELLDLAIQINDTFKTITKNK